jgi:putative membrane protein
MKSRLASLTLSFSTSLIVAIWLLTPANVARADDTSAFARFDHLNSMDLETARLAKQKGHSDGVMQLAEMIIHDHGAIQNESRRIAKKAGLKWPTPDANSELKTVIDKLKTKTGTAFDKAYLDHALPFSKAFIDALKTEIIPSVRNVELKSYLAGIAPRFEEHLKHIEHAAMQVDGTGTSPHGATAGHVHHPAPHSDQ